MIKRTIGNQSVTSSAWQSDVRYLDSKAYFYRNGEWTLIPNEIKEWDITKGATADDKFEIGTVFVPTASITFDGKVVSTDKYMRIDIGVLVGDAYEYITMGTFYISEKSVDAWTTNFTLTSELLGGRGGRANQSALNMTSVASLIQGIKTDMGNVPITTEYPFGTADLRAGFTQGTCRDVLGAIAKSYGMFVTENASGIAYRRLFPATYDSLVISEDILAEPFVSKGSFNLATGKIVASSGYSSDDISDAESIEYTYRKNGGTIETGVNLESYDLIVENQYMSDSTFEEFKNLLSQETTVWESGTIELRIGDPRLEPLDVVQLMDGDVQTHSIFAHHIVHKYDGGLVTTVSASMLDRSDSAVGYDVSGNGVAVVVPIINSKVDRLDADIEQITTNLGKVTEDAESLMSETERLEARVTSHDNALEYKLGTNLIKDGVARGSIEWDEDINALRIGGINADGNSYYETRVSGDGVQFLFGGSKEQLNVVASVNQDRLIINKTFVYTDSVIGNWAWESEANGNLTLKWRG